MSQDENVLKLPRYNDGAGQPELTMEPPFAFPGVTMRVFPVKANMFRLAAFCNRYLNIIPEHIGVFRPSSPIVVFAMINYGRMGSIVSNQGWVSQNEVVFTVMLDWYKRVNGKLVFHDFASVTPFLFVDSQTSLTTGREVYGWPKVLASLEAEVSPWTKSPRRDRRLMRLSTMTFAEAFAGQKQVARPLIEIDQVPPATVTAFPPRWDNLLNPFFSIPKAVQGMAQMAQDATEMLLRSPLQGYGPPLDPENGFAMLRRLVGNSNPLAPNLYNNTINLKQFRDASKPDEIAYQGITRSKIWPQRINAMGLLGDGALFRGDPTGGYRVRIHRYVAQPIVDALGLDVAGETQEAGVPVATLKPIMPYWLDLDMTYGPGETLAWRTQLLDWKRGGEGAGLVLLAPPGAPHRAGHKYNTARAGALQEISGPFHYPNTTVRVLPLMAHKQCLREFCQSYLDDSQRNAPGGASSARVGRLTVDPLGSYVYLMIFNFEEQSSETANIGRVTDRQAGFYIPIKVYDSAALDAAKAETDPKKRRLLEAKALRSLGMVSPFKYANSNLAAISAREINGWTTVQADIDSADGAWLAESGPSSRMRSLAKVTTDVLPALDMGQEVTRETLFEIIQGSPLNANESEEWRLVAKDWGPAIKEDYDKKVQAKEAHPEAFDNLKAMALHLLTQREPINEFSLKQFRDSEQPSRACYQAIVNSQMVIDHIYTLEEIEDPIHLAVHLFPSQNIVKTLGLKVKYGDATGPEPVLWIEPVRPFWAKVAMHTETPKELFYSVSENNWIAATETPSWGFAPPIEKNPGPGWIGPSLVREIDQQELLLEQKLNATSESKSWEELGLAWARDVIWAGPGQGISAEDIDELKREIRQYQDEQPRGAMLDESKLVTPDFWANLGFHEYWFQAQILRKRQNLPEAAYLWREKAAAKDHLDRMKGAEAIGAIDEIQPALESILSKEWANWGTPRWYKAHLDFLRGLAARKAEADEVAAASRSDLSKGAHNLSLFEQDLARRGWINEELGRLLDAQKPDFYLRADSLGSHAIPFRRQWGMLEREFFWFRHSAEEMAAKERAAKAKSKNAKERAKEQAKAEKEGRDSEAKAAKELEELRARLEVAEAKVAKADKTATAKAKPQNADSQKAKARNAGAPKATGGKKPAAKRTKKTASKATKARAVAKRKPKTPPVAKKAPAK